MEHAFEGDKFCEYRAVGSERFCGEPREAHKMVQHPPFIQIVTGAWHAKDKGLSHSVYGLTKDGQVYKNEKAGWKPI